MRWRKWARMRCATAGWTEISGGEKQRVILARALAQQPSLLLLDEPTQHLDIGGKVELLQRLRRLADENRYTVLVVTHELDLAAEFADRVVLLHKGKCLRVGTPAEVYERELLEEVFEAPLEVEMRPGGRPRVHSAGARLDFVELRFSNFCSSGDVRPSASGTARDFGCGAVHNHPRLRAREDGEKPSPPRDCKAKNFWRTPLTRRCESLLDSRHGSGRPR